MMTAERSYSSDEYRYGFNGKEKDSEWNSGGAMYDYGFRIYDPRIAKFLSVDPLTREYPFYTPYQFAGNKPIQFIDRDGLEESPVPLFFGELGISTVTAAEIENKVSSTLTYLGDKVVEGAKWLGDWNLMGSEPEDHEISGKTAAGIEFTKTDGKVAGSSPIQSTESTEHDDLTVVTDMVNVGGPPGGSAKSTLEGVKAGADLFNAVVDAVQQIQKQASSKTKTANNQSTSTPNLSYSLISGRTNQNQQNPPLDTIVETNKSTGKVIKTVKSK